MFADVRSEASDRLIGIQAYFRATCIPGYHRVALTAKGLAFVQMYSVYEYTVTNSVRAAIVNIKLRAMPLNTIRWELLGLILSANLESTCNCSVENLYAKRIALMQRINSTDVVDTSDATFPNDGTHFRRDQLETIWRLFGMASMVVPEGRIYPLIDELVSHRNAVAHGRVAVEDVGRRYSKEDVLAKIGQCERLCMYIISELENHCSSPANLVR